MLVHPPDAVSLDEAHAAIEQWEHYSGKRLDSAQRLAVEHMMAEDVERRWAARTTGRSEPRQNGKGDEFEVVEAWGLTQRAEAIVHTAHEIPTAKSAHLRLVAHLSHSDFRPKVKQVRYANGDQSVEMRNGGICVYRTRTAGGGRGLDDISRLIVDEAQHAQPEQLASSTPILAANPNPQIDFAGTAGIAIVSAWWWSMRRRALGLNPGRFGWLEHGAERVRLTADGVVVSIPPDPSDPAAWAKANPAYPSRIEHGYLAEQLALLGPALFAREHLGVWDAEPNLTGGVVSPQAWAARLFPKSQAGDAIAFAFAITPDRSAGSIAVSDGRHGEVVETGTGTAWMVPALAGIHERHPDAPIACDPSTPAGSLLKDIEALDVDVTTFTPREVAQACGDLFDAIVEELAEGEAPRFVHIGQAPLDDAIAGAHKRDTGAGGLWLWDARSSLVDTSPLEAVTLARLAAPIMEPYDVLDSVL